MVRLARGSGAATCAELLDGGIVGIMLSLLSALRSRGKSLLDSSGQCVETNPASDPSVITAACWALESLASNGGAEVHSDVEASGALDAAHAAVSGIPHDHDLVRAAHKSLVALEEALQSDTQTAQ